MFSLLVMVFFGITGITLNHPGWAFGTESSTETSAGVLPAASLNNGDVEFLAVSEFVRSQHDVVGEVSDFGLDGTNGTINYKAPGYSADLFFDSVSGDYSLSESREGFVGVMNELHKGRDADSTWRFVIDLSGVLLVVVGLTGIGIQLFLRKRRFSALTLSLVGALITVVLVWAAMP
jgi:hypothetical protein